MHTTSTYPVTKGKSILNFNSISKRLPHAIMIFFLIDMGLCSAYILNYLIGHPHSKLTSLLDLNGESSLAAWYSSTQYFCVFTLSAIFSYHKYRQNIRSISLMILPVIFLLMSIDETVQIHEWLGQKSDILLPDGSRTGTYFQETGVWMFVFGLPFLAFFLFLAYSLKDYFSENLSSFRKLIIGMLIMLTGALGVETLSNFVEGGFLVTEVVFEEGLEMIGVTVMLWAVYDMAIGYMPDMGQKDIQQ